MYICKNCGNRKFFLETYQVETIVTIENGKNVNSYDKKNNFIMVTCQECKDNTEDESILDLEGQTIIL